MECTYIDVPISRRIVGEQNIVWNTHMYVQGVQRQQMKWVRGFLEGQMGIDRRDIEDRGFWGSPRPRLAPKTGARTLQQAQGRLGHQAP